MTPEWDTDLLPKAYWVDTFREDVVTTLLIFA